MEWRVIPSFPEYEVSEFGDVRRWLPDQNKSGVGRIMNPHLHKGYRRYLLSQDGKRRFVKRHRLVAHVFIGPKPFEGAEVCHGDGRKENDHYSNLRWDTHQSNIDDRVRHRELAIG
jgi:hypothetical protein